MDKKEFESNFETIKSLILDAEVMSSEINEKSKSVLDIISNFLKSSNKRDKNLKDYIIMLKEFNYSDSNFSPVDLFPGIKTAKDMSDPEEMKKKTDMMKDYAFNVKESESLSNTYSYNTSIEMKQLFALLEELDKVENQIYDLSIDLLKKQDSIYDVGRIGK